MEKKEWKLKDVKGKTIFDICKDEELLKKVTREDHPYEHKSFIEGYDAIATLNLIRDYAYLIEDESLLRAADKAEQSYYRWCAKYEREHPGVIID